MKDIRIRKKQTAMKWWIEKYESEGWTLKDMEISPYGKIKIAVLINPDETERVILQPKVQRKYLAVPADRSLYDKPKKDE